jgi:mRNA interferase MazF
MTNFKLKQGDVVLVAFPFTDLSSAKTRPALVVSSDSFHRGAMDVILVGITSKIEGKRALGDFPLSLEDQRYAGLVKPSLVRLGKMVTLDRRLIRKKLGFIPPSTLSHLISILRQLLSEEPPEEKPAEVRESPARYKIGKSKVRNKKSKKNRF